MICNFSKEYMYTCDTFLSLQEDALNKSRTEDAAIAYTWYHYFSHPDQPEYILRLPMTKVKHTGGRGQPVGVVNSL